LALRPLTLNVRLLLTAETFMPEDVKSARVTAGLPTLPLAARYAGEAAKIRQAFESGGDGLAAAHARSQLIDSIVQELCREYLGPELSNGFSVVAVGGYGRQEMFPYSDVDLLFLAADGRAEATGREGIGNVARTLWDLRFRVGHSTHLMKECYQLQRDNLEFNISLLDCRYLAGDLQLFAQLHDDAVPHVVARDRQDLVRNLTDLTRGRHQKHGATIFHLEPNLKDAPGGLRDYHVSRWLALIAHLERERRWAPPESLWPIALRQAALRSFQFLAAGRSFLHYRRERDDNLLTYELQDEAAALGLGHQIGQALPPADWMRSYFQHARAVQRLTGQLLDEIPGPSLYGLFQDWRSRLSNEDFSVVRGRVLPRKAAAALEDAGALLNLFEMVARHGVELSREAERWVEAALDWLGDHALELHDLWPRLSRILALPHAAEALRDMHRVRFLTTLFPEFRVVDALVIRDFYHRYTVDEHSFRTIENLHALGGGKTSRGAKPAAASPDERTGSATGGAALWENKLGEILATLEQPELLYLALLFHDVGKGMPYSDHVRGSLEAVESVFSRLDLRAEARDAVRFLIGRHLVMSATLQRRDIFDEATVREFAAIVGSPERLKMLALFTYADIKAVNPEALTPWKAEMLWQLYAATSNYLSRSLHEDRVERAALAASPPESEDIIAQSKRLVKPEAEAGLEQFLEGLPVRYLSTHSPEEVVGHFCMALRLPEQPVQVDLRRDRHPHQLTVLTADRPFLFASLCGVLAAWGMNILKADAFANAAGMVLDTIRFVDLHRTLELNPSEGARLEKNIVEALAGRVNVKDLMSGRVKQSPASAKVKIPTQVRFEDAPTRSSGSLQSTILELIAHDRPGLLYEVSSALSELGCNIEVALIDTEGQKVIDVFYLTCGGSRLSPETRKGVGDAIMARL
jgi:[protein-PII] uridylyltransferase